MTPTCSRLNQQSSFDCLTSAGWAPIESERAGCERPASAPTALISHAALRSRNRAGKRWLLRCHAAFSDARASWIRGRQNHRIPAGYRMRRLTDKGDDKARRPKRIRRVGGRNEFRSRGHRAPDSKRRRGHGGERIHAYKRCLLYLCLELFACVSRLRPVSSACGHQTGAKSSEMNCM